MRRGEWVQVEPPSWLFDVHALFTGWYMDDYREGLREAERAISLTRYAPPGTQAPPRFVIAPSGNGEGTITRDKTISPECARAHVARSLHVHPADLHWMGYPSNHHEVAP